MREKSRGGELDTGGRAVDRFFPILERAVLQIARQA